MTRSSKREVNERAAKASRKSRSINADLDVTTVIVGGSPVGGGAITVKTTPEPKLSHGTIMRVEADAEEQKRRASGFEPSREIATLPFTIPPQSELDGYNSNAVRALYYESGLRVPMGAVISTLRGILHRLRDGQPLGYGLVAPK